MLRKAGVIRADYSGFTLIELMIATAIVAILGAVAIPAYFNHVLRTRQSEVVGELMAIKAAQERFFTVNSGYAGIMNKLQGGEGSDPEDMYAVGSTYTSGYYQYWITPGTSGLLTAGTIKAKGDLNGDGNFTDEWEVSIDDLSAKPKPPPGHVADEGFGWSSLGHLF